VKYHESWIAIGWSALQGPLVEGDKIQLPVEYFLDPTEHFRTTSLKLEALGPRVPKAGAREPISFDNTQHLWYGEQSVYWQVFTCRYQAPADLAEAGFAPVARGAGTALYDNLRVSVFEGTDFGIEALRVKRPPTIDGKLDDWDGKCPIPLIGRNQLHTLKSDYVWTPQNLNGVAYLR